MKIRGRSLRQAGQAVVEFSLIAILFFALVCGIVDFGRGIWSYNVLSNATREGARYGSTLHVTGTGSVGVPDCDGVRSAMNAASVGIGTLGTSDIGVKWSSDYSGYQTAHPGVLDAAAKNTCNTAPTRASGTIQSTPYYVTVSATYRFQLITPIISNIIDPTRAGIPLRSDSMMVLSY